MQRVQRQFGKILPRAADESQVGQLIKDFEHAVDLLGLLIKSTKAWQQSWKDILDSQERLIAGFANACGPIPGSSESSYNGPVPAETPPRVSRRVGKLHREYQSLREELDPDLRMLDSQVVGPANQAKDSMHAMKKTIKTRENCKLDFERYQGRRDALFNKPTRSERDNMALAKHESDVRIAKDTYDQADYALKSALPGLLSAVYSLVPQLLYLLIRTSNTLIATYYTTVHEFCQAERFPSPPQPSSEMISQWAELCKPAQSGIESLAICANPKRGRFGAAAPRVISGNVSTTSNSPRISPSRLSLSRDDASSTHSQEYVRRIPSGHFQPGQALLSPGYKPPPSPSPSDFLTPTGGLSKPDYFTRDRIPSTSSTTSISSSVASSVTGKKKPPPPPPKRKGGSKPEMWVTALYDFAGQNQGDLQMKEGDRIKVLKKTDSTNDWWEGECNGMRGSFPANYCKV